MRRVCENLREKNVCVIGSHCGGDMEGREEDEGEGMGKKKNDDFEFLILSFCGLGRDFE